MSEPKIKVREIKIEKNFLDFFFKHDGDTVAEISLNAGWHYIAKKFFDKIPLYGGDVENAANFIEDELMLDKALMNNGEHLVCHNSLVALMFSIDKTTMFSRSEMEVVFDEYADCATGEPASFLHLDFTIEKWTSILLIREIMYYLKFTEIEIGPS